MAIEIIPGYDFGVNETPTNLLLNRQATDLQIRNVPAELIDGTIVAIVFGDTTGVSGGEPTDTGWIWVDSAGHRNIQVTDDDATVPRVDARVWSAHGGWETSRYDVQGLTSQDSIPDGLHLWHGGAAFRLDDDRRDMDANFTPYGLSQVFTASPATNTRVCGRGLCVVSTGAQVTETGLRTDRPGILTDSPSQSTWRVLDQIGGHKAHFAGTVMGRSHGSSGDSVAGLEAAAWFTNRNLGKS